LALQGAVSRRCAAASAHAPPWRAGRVTDRTRALTPPRHVFEHAAVQFDQPDTVQFAGHVALAHASHLGPIPSAVSDIPNTQQPLQTLHRSRGQHRSGHVALAHGRVWASAGQAVPLCAAGTDAPRVRTRVPPPQVLEHVDHGPHAATTQSTAHGRSRCEHAATSRRSGGHAPPLCAGATATDRARALVPLPPHVREHAVQFDQGVTAQSTGHGCVAHGRVWFSGGHALPPNAGRPPPAAPARSGPRRTTGRTTPTTRRSCRRRSRRGSGAARTPGSR
jgi:hypothetical protein